MRSLLVSVSVLVAFTLSGQQKSASEIFFDAKTVHRHITLDKPGKRKLPPDNYRFSAFRVLDYRPDSSRLGLFIDQHELTDLRFYVPAAIAVQDYLNQAATNPQAYDTLLVILNECWISDLPRQQPAAATAAPFKTRIHFRAEAFIRRNDAYIPYLYLDTVVLSPRPVMIIAADRLTDVVAAFAEKVNATDAAGPSLQRRRRFSEKQLDSMNNERFLCPVLTNDALRPGVYATAAEFRNNQPSVSNYRIEQDSKKIMTLRLLDEEGKAYFSRKMWGYCDGEAVYAMMDGNLFPVLRYGRTHYVLGSKEYRVKTFVAPVLFGGPGFFGGATVPVSESVTRALRYYRLDMYTGEIW